MERDKHNFHLDQHGLLHLQRKNETVTFHVDDSMYCIEHVKMKNFDGDYFFFCAVEGNNSIYFIRACLLIVSCFFLLLTIIGYMLLPELQNLYGKALICYCLSLLVSFSLLSSAMFSNKISNDACIFLGKYCWICDY